MKRLIIFVLLACSVVSMLSALEIKEGRMRIVVDERNGRMAFYYLADMTRNQYVPLLYDQESRTSYPTLVIDQPSASSMSRPWAPGIAPPSA